MTDADDYFDTALRSPVMAVFRGLGAERSLELAGVAWDLGIDAVELPIQTADDVEALEAVSEAARRLGVLAGVGTVLTIEHVRRARDAGAMFSVSPSIDVDVLRASERAGVPMMPGIATPTELAMASTSGRRWVKVFPAVALGPAWFRAVAGPFPDARFVATGGLDASTARRYLDAGVAVVGVGSALTDPHQLGMLGSLVDGGAGAAPAR